jgi:hypothetical protein
MEQILVGNSKMEGNNKMENKNYNNVGTFQKSNITIVERG